MQAFLIIISIVWGILCLVLFFKVWGACDSVRRIEQHISVISDNIYFITQQLPKKESSTLPPPIPTTINESHSTPEN